MEEVSIFQIELSPENNEYHSFCEKQKKNIKRLIQEGFFEISGGRAIVDFKTGGEVDRVIRVLYNNARNVGLPEEV